MKILHVCARLPYPVEDGGSVYVYNTIQNLYELGHDITIASFISELHNQDDSALTKISKVYTHKGNFTEYNLISAIKSAFSRKPITVQHRMSIEIMEKILADIKEEFDIIFFEGLHTLNFFEIVKQRFPKAKTLLRNVNVEFELIAQRATQQRNVFLKLFLEDQARLMKKFELNALKKVDAITFISDLDLDKMASLLALKKPTLVNPPGALINKINFDNRPDHQLIAFSNWKWPPNLEGLKWFLDKVWPKIIHSHDNVRLKLAGNDLPQSIQNNLPERIEYLGFVDDLKKLNQECTIQIVPLISGSGVKLKMIEGLAYGNPIVSTQFGADGIEVINGVHLEIANSDSEFADKVLYLLNEKSHRRSLSESALGIIKNNYSWSTQINRLNDFINNLVTN
jgi:glycosyltransferase involved in cell wall biosynthesis